MNLTAHLRVTAELHGVSIVNQPGYTEDARAWIIRRIVKIGTIDSERDYLVALHELGHIVLQHEPDRCEGVTHRVLREELEAWKWALAHKRCALTQTGVSEIKVCLNSYVMAATGQPHRAVRAFLEQLKPDTWETAGPRGRLP